MRISKLSRRQKNVLAWVYHFQIVDTQYDAEHLEALGVSVDPQTDDSPQAQNVKRSQMSRAFRQLEDRELIKRTLHRGRLYVKLTEIGIKVAEPIHQGYVERGRWKDEEVKETEPQIVTVQVGSESLAVAWGRYMRVSHT
jgi:hypothetical protein